MAADDNKTVPGPTSYLPQTADPLLGKTLAGRYLITKKLGEGGMGSVYLASHNILEKQVALKILHGEFTRKADLVERFMQEAKAASRIRHENVIDISDFGTTPDGFVFFAMELLVGHDLHDEIARARLSGQLLPWSRSKKIFLQICSALSAAHALGIVHRDLKPENVYLVDFLGDPDFVKLLDFGIAKLTESTTEEGGRKLTKTGMLFGTPEYMSPEQARGEHVDHRVDIYAMGCILFQLVTGRVPFEGENFMGVLSLHLTEPPPIIPPEVFDRIGAPRALGDVIDHALVKDRTQRFQTIDALANAVRAVCGDPSPADRSQRMRAASVPAPVETKRARPPTGPIAPAQGSSDGVPRVRPQTPTGRQKTEWTGRLHVPEVLAESADAPRRSKLPLVIGAIVALGGIATVIAVVAMRGGGEPSTPAAPGSASGSAQLVVERGSAIEPPPPPPAPDAAVVAAPPLPAHVALTIDSSPRGATVTDTTTGKTLGKTRLAITVAGDATPHVLTFHLKGYADATATVALDHETASVAPKLEWPGAVPAQPPPSLDAGVAVTPPAPADAAELKKAPPDACVCTDDTDITDPCCTAAHGMHP